MNTFAVLAHPEPLSFNGAMHRTAVEALGAAGHDVSASDLYAMGFDPVSSRRNFLSVQDPAYFKPQVEETHASQVGSFAPDIEAELSKVERCELMIWQFPLWWFSVPAILKGWVDRVLRPEVAYRFQEGDSGAGVPEGLLQAKAAVVFTTSNTPRARELAVFGDPLETLWKNCIFGLCGVPMFVRKNFEVVVTSTPAQRQAWLEEVREMVCLFTPA
jgi:putative NADPH-quinone reductase